MIKTIFKKFTRSLTFKLLGGGLLLCSWICQNYLFDYWDKKSTAYSENARDVSDMVRSCLLYENLYYTVNLSTDSEKSFYQKEYISQAAHKYFLGMTVSTLGRDIDKDAKKSLINQMALSLDSVKDYSSFRKYLLHVNGVIGEVADIQKEAQTQVASIATMRGNYRTAFGVLYVLGSIFLLLGVYHEKS